MANRLNKIFKLLISAWIVYCLVCCFGRIKLSVIEAVKIWTNVIIPSVFPYIVLAKYLCNSDALDIFEVFPGKIIAKIFKLSNCSIKPFICSLFCGYPSGALGVRDLHSQNKIKTEEAQRVICFTNNAGPLFVISVIGGNMLGSLYKGVIIYIIQITTAFVFGYVISAGKKTSPIYKVQSQRRKADLCLTIKESILTTVNICGFMISAFVMCECAKIAINAMHINYSIAKHLSLFFDGMFEISAGVSHATRYEYSALSFGLICGFVSWSGISVIMQIKSVSGSIISTFKICVAKFIQGILAFVLGYIFAPGNHMSIKTASIAPTITVSLLSSVILFIYYMLHKKKKLSE